MKISNWHKGVFLSHFILFKVTPRAINRTMEKSPSNVDIFRRMTEIHGEIRTILLFAANNVDCCLSTLFGHLPDTEMPETRQAAGARLLYVLLFSKRQINKCLQREEAIMREVKYLNKGSTNFTTKQNKGSSTAHQLGGNNDVELMVREVHHNTLNKINGLMHKEARLSALDKILQVLMDKLEVGNITEESKLKEDISKVEKEMIRLISATDNEGDNNKNQNMIHRQDAAQCESTDVAVGRTYGLSIESTDLSKCQEVNNTPKKLKSTTLHDLEAASLHESPTREVPVGSKQKMELETPIPNFATLNLMRSIHEENTPGPYHSLHDICGRTPCDGPPHMGSESTDLDNEHGIFNFGPQSNKPVNDKQKNMFSPITTTPKESRLNEGEDIHLQQTPQQSFDALVTHLTSQKKTPCWNRQWENTR
eukprot:35037_1